ncbi:ankyrin repeat domain-containing protein 16-like isoform X1 [Homarus americanus]|uniref:Ankyrin repeat domain-containing protein 16-like n=1 Tax=Homarus americanus TaxID=6706 RepID=A0A8J5JYV2_HOMAM|nr:ankyrin repeat domain-containing protein 16-like isoform X1 [Homarus americanus]KAG7167147.1 Ankyrin repeat domain-containing protein 16-like [Homarus americanus]
MSTHSDTDVLSAVQRGDLNWLEKYTSENEVDWRTCIHRKSGDTALHIAAVAGCTQIMSWLLANGCDVCLEKQNMDGKRPLHSAAQAMHFPIVKILLDHGATVDPIKRGDWTPLMLACAKRCLKVIQLLVEHGANLRWVNKDGWTSFLIACREGFECIVNYLLDVDSSLWNTVSNNGRTPLHTAAMHGHESVVKILLHRGNYKKDEDDACGNTPLMEAFRMGHLNIARLLIIEHGTDIKVRDKTGRTAFHIAAEAGQLESVKTLIETYGVDVNLLSDAGSSAVHCAAREGQTEVVVFLIKMGCKVSIKDNNGRTALWMACASRKNTCAKKLVDFGAQDIADNKGISPSQLMPIYHLSPVTLPNTEDLFSTS